MLETLKKPTVAISAPRPETQTGAAGPDRRSLRAFLGQVWAIVSKDIRAELRGKEMASATWVFALLVLVVFNFAFDLEREEMGPAGPGMLWVAIVLAGMLGLNHVFAREREQSCLEGLLLCPVDRSVIYFGKLAGALIFTLALEVAVLPVFAVFTNLPVFTPGPLLVLLLGTVGFVAVGTLFAAIAVNARTREVLLPILLLPVATPVLVSAVNATGLSFDGEPWSELAPWLGILAAFDAIYLVLSPWLFDQVVQELGPE
jgi:heme exporter protein B